jgi:NADP-dependent 3-hydroxy acid dehydrogenase YdfG
MSIGVTGFRTTIAQNLLAMVPNETVVSIGRQPTDDVMVDFADEFDVTAIPPDLDRYLLAAGLLVPRTLFQQTFRETAASFAVNLTSAIRICEHVLSNNSQARIAIIGSESWRGSYDTSYFLAKRGINAYVEGRRLAFPEQQLVVVSPTIVMDAGMTTRRHDLDRVHQRAEAAPQQRLLDSAEVAELIHYCLYVNRGSLTNTVVSLNGGEFA